MPAHANFYVTIPENGYFVVTFQLSPEGIVSYIAQGPSVRHDSNGDEAAELWPLVTVLNPPNKTHDNKKRTVVDLIGAAFPSRKEGPHDGPTREEQKEAACGEAPVVQGHIKIRASSEGCVVVETEGTWPASGSVVSALARLFGSADGCTHIGSQHIP
ncbi:hypothetical protein FA95DRAFT_1612893 [Auriscalpium vulgare]|uniref:Uncharacterized protein n=1 Tax=Auriscalpium vulgare TaxID=40419 RepID=A0ACB8R4Y2_9AGAM|nr:hypothetical protein FA95DRAFT_1612893 [Auriscalpium vulgare]